MRSILLITFWIISLGVLQAGGESESRFTHQVILKGDWTPTAQETTKALSAAIALVQKTAAQSKGTADVYQMVSSQKILKRDYAVQFTGKMVKGKKVIECNFFPADEISGFKTWKKSPVDVFDGGYNFWQVDYDVETESCGTLRINGVA